jgi:hypothetical protein
VGATGRNPGVASPCHQSDTDSGARGKQGQRRLHVCRVALAVSDRGRARVPCPSGTDMARRQVRQDYRASVLGRRSELVLLVLVPAVLGLVIGYLTVTLDRSHSIDAPGEVSVHRAIPGMGFVILVVLGIVGPTSVVLAFRKDRAQRAKQMRRPIQHGKGRRRQSTTAATCRRS